MLGLRLAVRLRYKASVEYGVWLFWRNVDSDSGGFPGYVGLLWVVLEKIS